jgi:glycosyltransferase involved in cell wall biosynthesis
VAVFSPAVTYQALACRFPGVPLVYLPHARIAPVEVADPAQAASPILRWVAYHVHYRAEREALLKSATTVRFTPGTVALLRQYYHLPARTRFEVIPQAIEASIVGSAPRRQGPLRLLAVGRLVPSKNIRLLLTALANIDGAWHLDIVGDGPARGALEAQARQTGLSSRVTFHGHQDAPSRFYARADLLAFPSRLENVSLVVLEAMAHGVPAVVVRSDGVNYLNVHHEIIRDGVDGRIAADEADFAHQLQTFIREPGALRRMAPAAIETARKHTWDAALGRWDALLTTLAARRPRRTA